MDSIWTLSRREELLQRNSMINRKWVCVKSLRKNENEQMIETFFKENVGPVYDVEIYKYSKHQPGKRFAYVEFHFEADATKAIIGNKYIFNKHYIFVTKPFADHSPNKITTTILQLNDDCLLQIYKYLNLFEIVNLSLLFPRLNDFAQTHIYKKYATFTSEYRHRDFKPITTDPSYLHILTHIGPFINNLSLRFSHMDNPSRDQLNTILENCKSLEHLQLDGFDKFNKCLYLPPTIKSLTLDDCSNLHNFVKFGPNLDKFAITGKCLITDDSRLQCINNLTELCLKNVKINNYLLKNIIHSNKKIRKLILNNCRGLKGNIYYDIDKYLPELEILCIDLMPDMKPDQLNCLANLKSLLHLQIFSCRCYISSYLNNFGDYLETFEIFHPKLKLERINTFIKSNKLKKLKISYPFNLTDDIFMICRQLPKLEQLHFHGYRMIDVLQLIEYVKITPQLKSLIFTNSDYSDRYYNIAYRMLNMLIDLNMDKNLVNQRRFKLIMDFYKDEDIRVQMLRTDIWKKYPNLLILSEYQPKLDKTRVLFNSIYYLNKYE